jgi:hypothetical protein
MYYGLSHNEQFYADRVSVFIALGPVMELTHCKSTLIHFVAAFETLLVDLLCGSIPQLCNFGLYLITDEDPTLNDAGRTPVYLGHFPSGTSLRSLNHYGQILNAKKFQRMDFGSSKNKQLYN